MAVRDWRRKPLLRRGLTPLQTAYLAGYKQAMTRMRQEMDDMLRDLKRGWDEEVADLRHAIEGVERHCRQARDVTEGMAERTAMTQRDSEVRLH